MSQTAREQLDEMMGMDGEAITNFYKLEPKSIKPSGVDYGFTNAHQVGGNHYQGKSIQPWDYIVSNNMGYLAGNIIKYVSRYKDKNGVEDLMKAKHYIEKLIEVESNANK